MEKHENVIKEYIKNQYDSKGPFMGCKWNIKQPQNVAVCAYHTISNFNISLRRMNRNIFMLETICLFMVGMIAVYIF